MTDSSRLPAQLPPLVTLQMPIDQLRPLDVQSWQQSSQLQIHDNRRFQRQVNDVEARSRVPRSTSDTLQPHSSTKPLRRPKPPEKAPQVSIDFVSIHTASGRRDAAAESKIRAHAMRLVHHKRRISKEKRPSSSEVCRCQLDQLAECRPVQPLVSTQQLRGTELSHSTDPETDIPLAVRVRTAASGSPQPPVNCTQCGKLAFQYWPAVGHIPVSLSCTQTAASFDPFNTAAISISHRLHELLHHCGLHAFH